MTTRFAFPQPFCFTTQPTGEVLTCPVPQCPWPREHPTLKPEHATRHTQHSSRAHHPACISPSSPHYPPSTQDTVASQSLVSMLSLPYKHQPTLLLAQKVEGREEGGGRERQWGVGERGGVGGGEWERGEEGEGGEGGRGRGGRMDGWREGGRSLEGRWEGREGGREMGPSPHAQYRPTPRQAGVGDAARSSSLLDCSFPVPPRLATAGSKSFISELILPPPPRRPLPSNPEPAAPPIPS